MAASAPQQPRRASGEHSGAHGADRVDAEEVRAADLARRPPRSKAEVLEEFFLGVEAF